MKPVVLKITLKPRAPLLFFMIPQQCQCPRRLHAPKRETPLQQNKDDFLFHLILYFQICGENKLIGGECVEVVFVTL